MLFKIFQVSYEVVITWQKLGFLLLSGNFSDDIGYKGCYEHQDGGGFLFQHLLNVIFFQYQWASWYFYCITIACCIYSVWSWKGLWGMYLFTINPK